MEISIIDSFKVQKRFYLSGEDTNVLTLLYLPLIGIDSHSLYYSLFALDEESYQVKKILDIMNFSQTSFLEKSLQKLEAIGLLDRFYSEKNGYIFLLKHPQSAQSFFKNTILAPFLASQIGEVEYKKLYDYFFKLENNISKSYKNITKRFDEVFASKNKFIQNEFVNRYKNIITEDIKVQNDKFDYILFKLSFDTSFLDESLLDSDEFQKEILRISYHYQLNEDEMKDAVVKAISIDKDLSYENVSKNASYIYRNKHNDQEIRFVPREADIFIVENENTNPEEAKFIEIIDNMSCSQVLEKLNHGKAAISDLKMFEDLRISTSFPQGVINVLIFYVNENKEGELPGLNYFEKIATTWKRAGVKTTKDAIAYINKPKETKKPKFGKKKAVEPEWFKEYEEQQALQEQTKKEEQATELTEEEIRKGLEEAKKLFGDGDE